MERWRRRDGIPLVAVAAVLVGGCSPESRPTGTTSISAPLDKAKPLAGLQPEAITVPQSAQFTAYTNLRTTLNAGATALDGGDKAKAADQLAQSKASYDKDFAEVTKSTDATLHDRITKSYDAMAAAAKNGDAGIYRFNRYTVDIGILRLAALKIRDALKAGDKATAEQWFSTVSNRFDLSKDIQPIGSAWKRVQTGPIDAATQKAVNLSLASYLIGKARGEFKGSADGLNEKNLPKARWEVAGGANYFEAIKEAYQEQLGADATKKAADTLLALDAAIVAGDDGKARTLLDQVSVALDNFDKSIAA